MQHCRPRHHPQAASDREGSSREVPVHGAVSIANVLWTLVGWLSRTNMKEDVAQDVLYKESYCQATVVAWHNASANSM